jgi:acyl-CoA synthetase (AMP-forming)/AMP-acid ligase II
MITSNPYDGARKAGTVGMPLPGVQVRITGPGGVLPAGEAGAIEVRGPNVFQGYWRLPEKTAEEFRDGWFITGDLGAFDAEGYLSILGRAKDLVITGGLNVYPAEVEAALLTHPDIAQAQVFGLPDARLGEEVAAWIVLRPGAALDAEALRDWCRGRMAGFKIPRRIRFVPEFPMTATGKAQKFRMREAMLAEAGAV